MLEVQKLPSMEVSAPPVEPGLGDQVTAVLQIVRRQYPIVLLCALIGIICGIIYVRVTPPTYTAQAEILVDRAKSPFIQQQSILADIPVDTIQLESQMEIMRSPNIALSVIKKLHLDEDAQFVRSGGGVIRSITSSIAGFFAISGPQEAANADLLKQQALRALLENLEVKRVGATYLIDVDFRSRSPNQAAQIANAVADAYISDQLDAKFEANRRASEWLQGRLEELRKQSLAAEQAVVSYRNNNKLVDAGGKPISEQELTELNTQLVTARAKTSEALARLNRIDATLSTDRPNAAVDATVSDALSNPVITKLRQDYLDYVNKETEYTARYGKDHLAVINIRNKVRDLRNSITSELRRMAETFKSDYLIAKQRQDDIEHQLAASVAQSQTVNSAQVTLRELESAAQNSRSLYNLFQQRYLESSQQQSSLLPEARVVSAAAIPDQRSSKNPAVVLAVSFLGGLMLGGALGVLRDAMDRVFRTGGQVDTILRAPCVALVPLIKKESKKNRLPPDGNPRPAPINSRTIMRDSSVIWTVLNSPVSRFAEAIRSVKLAADLTDTKRSNIIIGVTSALPNEGKSTVAISLAQLIAQIGRRVIVVDCDLRNPSLSRSLAPAAQIGLVEVLSGERPIGEVIWTEEATNLAFVPAVKNARLIHTSEILASAATKKLFDQLRHSYDYVVIDLPPIAPVVDVRATTHLVDFYFLVVEWGSTKIDVVQHALKAGSRIYDNLAGVILNKTNMDYIERYDVHNRRYYNNKDYARYGYTE
jgi:polysaccharide biosynthesis transport protein